MEKSRFVKSLDRICDAVDFLHDMGDFFARHGGEFLFGDEVGFLVDESISLLEEAMDDRDDMVSWFVFENDMGKGGLECQFGEEVFEIKTKEDLYEFIKKVK